MKRQPVALTHPACFGLSFAEDNRRCRLCSVSATCSKVVQRWSHRKSLAERLTEAREAAQTRTLDQATLEAIYDDLHLQHFGRKSFRRRSVRNNAVFGRLLSYLLTHEIDPETYITANMVTLGPHVTRFYPTMLSGANARGRYNAFLRRANRRYSRGFGDVADRTSALGQLRTTLAEDEEEVGMLFVRSRQLGDAMSWEDAIAAANPSGTWRSFQREEGTEFARYRRTLHPAGVEREKRLATLTAAVAVAEATQTGLASRVGFTVFSWGEFADLLADLFPLDAIPDVQVDIPGLQRWTPGVS